MTNANGTWLRWSSGDGGAAQKTEAFAEALSTSHLPWSLDERVPPSFFAEILMRRVRDLQVSTTACDPCSARRGRQEIAQGTEPYFGLLLVQQGRDEIRFDGERVLVNPGEVFLWDSTRQTTFSLTEKLRTITVLMPQEALRGRVLDVQELVGTVLPTKQGLGALAYSTLDSLSLQLSTLDEGSSDVAVDLLTEFLVSWLQRVRPQKLTHPQGALLRRIQSHLDDHLSDPALGPQQVAQHFHISLRYAHQVFATSGTSISRWVCDRRMERCRRELLLSNESISSIAYQWGFSDLSRFHRVFKRRYLMTPGQYRKRYGAGS